MTLQGHSIGHGKADTLVVDTTAIVPHHDLGNHANFLPLSVYRYQIAEGGCQQGDPLPGKDRSGNDIFVSTREANTIRTAK